MLKLLSLNLYLTSLLLVLSVGSARYPWRNSMWIIQAGDISYSLPTLRASVRKHTAGYVDILHTVFL